MARFLVQAAEVITCDQAGTVIPQGALIVENDAITAIGPAEQLRARGPFDREIGSVGQSVVLPGLINGHYHAQRPGRAALPASSLESWLVQTRQRMLPMLDDDEVYDHVLWDAIQNLKKGVTALMDHHNNADRRKPDWGLPSALHAYRDSGIRVVLCPSAYVEHRWAYQDDLEFMATLPEPLQSDLRAIYEPFPVDAYFSVWHELYKTYHGAKGRLHMAFGPGGPSWCREEFLRRTKREAVEHGVGIHFHLLETRYEALYARRTFGKSAVAWLNDIGLLGPGLACAHCVWLSEEDQRLMADTGTVAVHNPAMNLWLTSGISPMADGLERGMTVGFGSDASPLNEDHDLLTDLRLGWYVQRAPGIGRPVIEPKKMLAMATRGSAAALWQQDSIGSLEVGKQADMIVLNRERLYDSAYAPPDKPVVDTILRRGAGHQIDAVMVGGQVVVEGGEYLLADEVQVSRRVAKSLDRFWPLIDKADELFGRLRPHIVDFYRRWDDEAGHELPPRFQYNTR